MLLSLSEVPPTSLIVTPEMEAQAKGAKMAGTIVISARDFLKLTCVDTIDLNDIMKEALPLEQYITYSKQGKNIHLPWLDICVDGNRWDKPHKKGSVIGHEGRHRAAAVINAGGKTLIVSLCAKFNGYSTYKVNLEDKENPWKSRFINVGDFPDVFYGQFKPDVAVKPKLDTFKSFYP